MKKKIKLSPSEIREKNRYTIFDLKYLWSLFTSHKKWFALSVVLCLFLAGTYVYLSRPSYSIQGKMMIIDRRQSGSTSVSASSSLMSQLPSSLSSSLNLNRTTNAENEKEIRERRTREDRKVKSKTNRIRAAV